MNLPQLTFTRFIAAVSIVIIHFGLFTWPFNTNYLAPICNKALAAVSYFFVLSGFILVVSTSKNGQLPNEISSKKFWINRCARILPLYLLSITIPFLLNFHYDPSIPLRWQIQSFIYSIFLLQSWKYRMVLDVNYPAWTLSVEAFFYFIFPWLYVQLNQCNSKKLIKVAAIAWLGNAYLFTTLLEDDVPHNFAYYFPLFHVATFLTGIASGILFIRHYQYLISKSKIIWSTTIVLTLFLLYALYNNFSFFNYYHNGLLSPWFIGIIFSLAIIQGKPASLLGSKPMVFLGDISFAIYILQVPVMEILVKYVPFFSSKEAKDTFFAYLIVLIGVSTVAYYLVEKPFRKAIKRLA